MEVQRPDSAREVPQDTGFRRDHHYARPVSVAMRELERIVVEIAPTDIPVLIIGESGSGKEAIARQIHQLSPRANAPFAKLACATVTAQVAEKILGFDEGLPLVKSLLNAGTIFLDEVSDLDMAVHPRLLHVLSDSGAVTQGRCWRARIISSTARDPMEEVRHGRFREELYYRLNGVCLRLPPLRSRREDIPPLVEFFLAKHAPLMNRPTPSVTPKAMAKLMGYHWPGNIRQLEYAVKKVVALGDEELALRDFDGNGSGNGSEGEVSGWLSLKQAARAASRQAEREMILKVLERTRWNRKRAARELRISYKALLYKLKQIGVDSVPRASDGQEEHQ